MTRRSPTYSPSRGEDARVVYEEPINAIRAPFGALDKTTRVWFEGPDEIWPPTTTNVFTPRALWCCATSLGSLRGGEYCGHRAGAL